MDKPIAHGGQVFVRNPYNYDVKHASIESGLKCVDESRTHQSQAQDADINVIVRRFGLTGVLPQGMKLPTYGDFEGIFDYHDALSVIQEADAVFAAVPAEIRSKFDNDAGKFVAFCSDPGNLEELRKLGLAKPAEVVPPVVAPAKPA